MRFSVPAYLQVERGRSKPIFECDYHEFVSALMRETEPTQEAELSRLLRAKLDEWRATPRATLGEIVLHHRGAYIRFGGSSDRYS